MKYIVKGAEPQKFSRWKSHLKKDGSQRTFADLRGSTKKTLKTALMKEQKGICCYCECNLHANDSHIEHLTPQCLDNADSLDFSNMLCSCQGELKEGDPRHCGNLKGDWFKAELLISPLDPTCEQCFKFTEDGHIHPSENRNKAATETISHLGLDIPKLVAMRKEAIDPFLEESLTPEQINKFAVGYLQETTEETFNEFWTTIKYLFARDVAV